VSILGWIGAVAGALALVVVIQTLRLRAAQQRADIAEQRAADAVEVAEASKQRELEEKAVATKLAKRLQQIARVTNDDLREIAKNKLDAMRDEREVMDAALKGDTDAVLDVLGDLLDGDGDGGTVPHDTPAVAPGGPGQPV